VQPLKKSRFGILCLFSPAHFGIVSFFKLLNKSNENDEREEVENYQNYYLGPVVFSVDSDNSGKMSIIDGQQRVTSITLLLIYLNNRQKKSDIEQVNISELIYSEKYGKKSFNMSDESREKCLQNLFEKGEYFLTDSDDETSANIVYRYTDIVNSFPEEINEMVLPYFIDWLIEKVVVVKIIAYSNENAYTIFETMNDRGLNLTPTEMLKGYILSKITDKEKRNEINDLWKKEIQKLHEFGETTDQDFFQSWFRGKFASTIRPGRAGSEDQDFELIGSRFHNWFKENHEKLFSIVSPNDIFDFFKYTFPFYVKVYILIKKSLETFNKDIPHLYYIKYWGIAESLRDPLLFSSININDTEETIFEKLDAVSRFIETFTVRRSINFKNFGHSSIKYTMFNIIKNIRNNDIIELCKNLLIEIENIPQKWDGILKFYLHGTNGGFVKHLLSRITSYIDNIIGKDINYSNYHHPKGKQFEIEHIWANKFDEHRDEFEQENEFYEWRNSIGALLLLPNGTNQSFNSDNYEDKLEHYLKENTFAQTLHQTFYVKNPNFLNSPLIKIMGFEPHEKFKKNDIIARKILVKNICENMYGLEYFKKYPNVV
ncbi:MAG: DUF262 domain-containing protein, partial [Treponema sp.]|nr:DUF262 domain-containing protein [Treponema sp.]